MDVRSVDPRDANDPRATDAVDRGEIAQQMLPRPRSHEERATEVPELDDDGLESGRDEPFRGFIEAGDTWRGEDQASGERKLSACDCGPGMIAHRECGSLLEGAD